MPPGRENRGWRKLSKQKDLWKGPETGQTLMTQEMRLSQMAIEVMKEEAHGLEGCWNDPIVQDLAQ